MPSFRQINSVVYVKPAKPSVPASSRKINRPRSALISEESKASERRNRDTALRLRASKIGIYKSCSWRRRGYSWTIIGSWRNPGILIIRLDCSKQIFMTTNTSPRSQNLRESSKAALKP